MALARMEWMKTSASNVSARSAVLPSSDRRSSTTLRLPRLTFTKTPLIPGSGPTEMWRVLSPSGGSILMTSAPMSAIICVQYGPITIAVTSTTSTPASGPLATAGHLEAVADVVRVTVGHHPEYQRGGRVPDGIHFFTDLLDGPCRPVDARRFGDYGPRNPAGDSDEHLARNRTGFVGEPAHHGRHLLGLHARISRSVKPISHSRQCAGNDDVALHTLVGALECDHVGQADHARLGHRVIRDAMVAVQAADRRRQHDTAVPRLTHHRERGPDNVKRSPQMHIHDRLEVLVRHLLQGSSTEGARIVDEDVDAAIAVQRRLHNRIAARWRGHRL